MRFYSPVTETLMLSLLQLLPSDLVFVLPARLVSVIQTQQAELGGGTCSLQSLSQTSSAG